MKLPEQIGWWSQHAMRRRRRRWDWGEFRLGVVVGLGLIGLVGLGYSFALWAR